MPAMLAPPSEPHCQGSFLVRDLPCFTPAMLPCWSQLSAPDSRVAVCRVASHLRGPKRRVFHAPNHFLSLRRFEWDVQRIEPRCKNVLGSTEQRAQAMAGGLAGKHRAAEALSHRSTRAEKVILTLRGQMTGLLDCVLHGE